MASKRKARASITNSERQAAACPQRWLLRYGLGLRSQESTPALYIGSLVHSAIEALYRLPTTTVWSRLTVRKAIEQEHQRWIDARRESLGGFFDLSLNELQAANEQAAIAARIADAYIAEYRTQDWRVVKNEQAFDTSISKQHRMTTGRLTVNLAGKVDRVIEHQGRTWIVETKTSSIPLEEWVERNRRGHQAITYAVALREQGIEVDGVIFDLVNSKPAKRAEDLAVLKDGSRLAKPAGLPYTTASEFERAVSNLGQNLDSVDWYRPAHQLMRMRDASGFWFRREPLLFDRAEVQRTQREIERSMLEMGKWRHLVDLAKRATATISDTNEADGIEATLSIVSREFPRQPALCFQYNRLCSYASICASQSAEDASRFVLSRSANGHDELHPESDSALEP